MWDRGPGSSPAHSFLTGGFWERGAARGRPGHVRSEMLAPEDWAAGAEVLWLQFLAECFKTPSAEIMVWGRDGSCFRLPGSSFGLAGALVNVFSGLMLPWATHG